MGISDIEDAILELGDVKLMVNQMLHDAIRDGHEPIIEQVGVVRRALETADQNLAALLEEYLLPEFQEQAPSALAAFPAWTAQD
ncbi:MAG: hypothetical protein HC824_08520 [Synechococcales cyanobacterium RM1_1_8]|nr:hypothetical protein [Synechococcales cyanobacterium RM1_1_8]